MTLHDRLTAELEGRLPEMLGLLERVVRQNSYTANKAGGDAVGAMFAEEARRLGLAVTTQESARFANHQVFSTPDVGPGFVTFVGHVDTVFPEGSFEVFERNGDVLRGPGTLDMKGGIVVMLEALGALLRLGAKPNVKVLLVGDEEVGSPEGRAFIEAHAKGSSAALVFEAGRAEDKIITRRKGTGSLKVRAEGKAAHAANGHKDGVNAIWAMAHFITKAQSITNYDLGTTVNVGVIRGGEAKNTVPDACEVEVDFRFTTVAEASNAEQALFAAAKAAEELVPGSKLTWTGGKGRNPLERTEESGRLFERYAEEAKRAGLGFAEAGLIAGGSDASSTSAIGIPSIDGLGPRGAGFHTKDEHIIVSSLVPKTLALATFVASASDRP